MNANIKMKNILDQINDYSNQLLQVLTKEHDALSLNHLDKLIPLSEKKQELVTKLDDLDKQRTSLSTKKDFTAFLKQVDPRLVSIWLAAAKVVKKCQQQNEINGRILYRRNSIARETMEILTGRKDSNETTYGPNGIQNSNGSLVTNIQV